MLIAGIYGMNFKDMPEYDLPHAYPICIAVMLALDVGLYLWFKKIKWL
jgi:magnesium transporter